MESDRSRSGTSGTNEPEVLTVEEAAKLLRISRGTAYEAIRQGEIPSVRVGRRILVPRRALLEHLSRSAASV